MAASSEPGTSGDASTSGDNGTSGTSSDVTSTSAGEAAEGGSSPCFDVDSCVSRLVVQRLDDAEEFAYTIDIDPDVGSVTCPEGTGDGWPGWDHVTIECAAGTLTIEATGGLRFPDVVTITDGEGEPQEYGVEFEDDGLDCGSACNQGLVEL